MGWVADVSSVRGANHAKSAILCSAPGRGNGRSFGTWWVLDGCAQYSRCGTAHVLLSSVGIGVAGFLAIDYSSGEQK